MILDELRDDCLSRGLTNIGFRWDVKEASGKWVFTIVFTSSDGCDYRSTASFRFADCDDPSNDLEVADRMHETARRAMRLIAIDFPYQQQDYEASTEQQGSG